jgi:hypothetical protein
MDKGTNQQFKIQALISVAIIAVVAVFFVAPVPQNPDYHNFADQRSMFGIPNFWNVITNIPFFFAGIFGLAIVARRNSIAGPPEMRVACLMFFAGTALVCLGSGYYHLAPSNQTLLWDRLPMTIAFMAFFSMIVGDYISPDAARRLLWPLIICGLLSVFYWGYTETLGEGDLRFYALVQFLPALLVVLIILMFRSTVLSHWSVWAILATYLAAKGAEMLDYTLFEALGGFSGHSIKHVVAAIGPLILGVVLLTRKSARARHAN